MNYGLNYSYSQPTFLRNFLFIIWLYTENFTFIYIYIYIYIYLSQKLFKLDEPDMQDTAGEAGTNS